MTAVTTGNAGFGGWLPLDAEGISSAPDAPCAVQVATRDRRLIAYPSGKSTMVFYFYAARSARGALERLFRDELLEPGARGQGPLSFRVLVGGDDARAHLERLFAEFEARFGAPPILHVVEDEVG